jgi:L-lactate utilization protein LutB
MNELKTLRDEIRLGLHLAGMDFKDEWQKIERTLPDLSRTAAQLGDAASETLDRLAAELRRFQDRLRKRGGAHDPQAPSS